MQPGAAARRFLAALLAAALLLLSPGIAPYEALASQEARPPGEPGRVSIPKLADFSGLGAKIPGLAGQPAVAGSGQIPALPPSAVLPQASPAGLAPHATAATPLGPAEGSAAASATEQLGRAAAGVEAANEAGDPGGVQRALNWLFARQRASDDVGAALGASGAGPTALRRLELPELKALARDPQRLDSDRRAAVKAIADRSDDPARLALEEIGREVGGFDADYEIKRLALQRLKRLGKTVSLPEVSSEHQAWLMERLAQNPPQVLASDYDDTLEPAAASQSRETSEAFERLRDSGVRAMILTGRSDSERPAGTPTILDSQASLTPRQRGSAVIGADYGARILRYTRDDRPMVVYEEPGWSQNELKALRGIASTTEGANSTVESRHRFVAFLDMATTPERLSLAAQRWRERLAGLGLGYHVEARSKEISFEGRPKITVFKVQKGVGVRLLRSLRETFDRLDDVERYLPRWAWPIGRAIVGLLPARPAPAKATVLVGDKFFGPNAVDADMLYGAPGALTFAVAGAADPDLENTYVLQGRGHEAAMLVLRAASAPAAQPEGFNKKAAWGLFTARTVSIAAFLGTTLAYARAAQEVLGHLYGPAMGSQLFGALAALGTLVAVAAGPLAGKIADKFSTRAGMVFNAALRAFFLLDLPLFSYFGILNFWTLLLGSVANGWVLSSIMTTEGAYLRRLFGVNSLRTVNSLLLLNYFALQIILGLILEIGKLVDGHDLMLPFYIASAANALVVLPILFFTMPATRPGASPDAQPARPQASALSVARGLIRRYWREAFIFAAAVASFPLLHSALPITLALVYWIARSEVFKAVAADKPLITAIALLGLGAFALYGLQLFGLPKIAVALAGMASSAELLGKLLGALFLGQMISLSSLARLPAVHWPFLGRFDLRRLVQVSVLGMVALWVAARLVPGAWLAVAAATCLAAAMMAASDRIAEKGWLSLFGVGTAFLALPAIFWGHLPVLLGSLLVFGYFLGPATASLMSYVQQRAPQDKIGAVIGIQGSMFNAGNSLGVASFALLASLMTPMFPGALWAFAALAVAIGLIYFLGARALPGLPSRSKDHSHGKPQIASRR